MSEPRSGLPEGVDAYKVLQVDPEADPDVIQAAYRRLAQKHHPDRSTGDDAARRMIAINAAWEVLRDPERRARYDVERAAGPAPPRTPDAEPGASAARRPSATDTARSSAGGASGWGPDAPGAAGSAGRSSGSAPGPAPGPRPETVSPDWTSGRSHQGGGYDPATMRSPDGHGAAGPPRGEASGSVLNFGRYAGWSLGQVARADVEYLEWLDRAPIGRAYRDELDVLLRALGRRRTARPGEGEGKRGLFRRR